MITIYALVNPINEQVFYVGASHDVQVRYKAHIQPSQLYRTFKGNIIMDILGAGLKPELLVLDKVDYDKAAFYEDFYVDLFKSYGFTLKQDRSNYKGTMLSKFRQRQIMQNVNAPTTPS